MIGYRVEEIEMGTQEGVTILPFPWAYSNKAAACDSNDWSVR
jgi:hypothetical protein